MNLTKEYFQLRTDGKAIKWEANAFWEAVMGEGANPDSKAAEGYLLSSYFFKEDWASWEKHPAGDEILILIQGEIEMILERGNQNKISRVKGGEAFLIPKNTWHTAKIKKPCQAIFITYGRGTEHRDK